MPGTRAPLLLCYTDQFMTRMRPADASHLLGVVGYGAERPDALALSCPFVAAPLMPLANGPALEIWAADSPAQPCRVGPVIGACSGELAFGMLTLQEEENLALEAVVERGYDDIFRFLEQTGFNAPIRFWNYLTSITADEQGMERYRRFNIGRHRAFMARLRQQVPPAASCLGGHPGKSIIYFLAAHEAARAIENPRQVSAYAYPPIYGPRSPSFSRAALYGEADGGALFISGTASIVGHETKHPGDLHGQIAETIENLKALIVNAGQNISAARSEDWALKIYLRNPLYHTEVERALNAVFGMRNQRLYLQAEICRTDLLVEVEAFHQAGGAISSRYRPR